MKQKGLKVVVIGGGSSYTPELMEGFIQRYHELPVREIVLVDIEAGKEKLEIVGELSKRMVAKAGLDIAVHVTLDRQHALVNADFVVTQLRVGLLNARIQDEKIPLQYNLIGQETTGAGGFAKALRTIPVLLDICRDIERLAPEAWLINFTNPAGIVTEAILKYTRVKTIGLCNVPIGIVDGVAKIIGVDRERVTIDFVGLNHLVWGTHVYLDGADITEKCIKQMQDGEFMMSIKNIPNLEWDAQFIGALGMIPCYYHRYYYMREQMLLHQQEDVKEGKGTRGEQVQAIERELFALYKDPLLEDKPPQLADRGGAHYSDAACSLINSIYNNKKDIQVVNVRNNGTIIDLPDDVVIERNCVIDHDGAHPIPVGSVPVKIRGLLQSVKAYEQLTVEAGVHGDRSSALLALINHPLVADADAAQKVWKDLLSANSGYLPQFK